MATTRRSHSTARRSLRMSLSYMELPDYINDMMCAKTGTPLSLSVVVFATRGAVPGIPPFADTTSSPDDSRSPRATIFIHDKQLQHTGLRIFQMSDLSLLATQTVQYHSGSGLPKHKYKNLPSISQCTVSVNRVDNHQSLPEKRDLRAAWHIVRKLAMC